MVYVLKKQHPELVHFTLSFCRKRTAIVLFIKPFVWRLRSSKLSSLSTPSKLCDIIFWRFVKRPRDYVNFLCSLCSLRSHEHLAGGQATLWDKQNKKSCLTLLCFNVQERSLTSSKVLSCTMWPRPVGRGGAMGASAPPHPHLPRALEVPLNK